MLQPRCLWHGCLAWMPLRSLFFDVLYLFVFPCAILFLTLGSSVTSLEHWRWRKVKGRKGGGAIVKGKVLGNYRFLRNYPFDFFSLLCGLVRLPPRWINTFVLVCICRKTGGNATVCLASLKYIFWVILVPGTVPAGTCNIVWHASNVLESDHATLMLLRHFLSSFPRNEIQK